MAANKSTPRTCQRWSPEDDAVLKSLYPSTDTAALAGQLGRSHKSVVHRAALIGVAKTWGLRPYTPKKTLSERLASRSEMNAKTGCLEWAGARSALGYGLVTNGSKKGTSLTRLAHRISWELTHGEIPPGMFVCHRCDNPPCINVAHLFLADCLGNNLDRAMKGRRPTSRRGMPFGVSPNGKKFCAQVRVAGTFYYGGNFDTQEEAAVAALSLRAELWSSAGYHDKLNPPTPTAPDSAENAPNARPPQVTAPVLGPR